MNGEENWPVFAEIIMDSSPSLYFVTVTRSNKRYSRDRRANSELGATPMSLDVGSEILNDERLLKPVQLFYLL
jgi:hypothetical protein